MDLKTAANRNADMTCPNQPPKTAMGAARIGSIVQTQIDIATIENAKPEIPCTRPAMAAPIASIHMSLIDESY